MEVSDSSHFLRIEILTSDISELKALCALEGVKVFFEYSSGQRSYLICELTKGMLQDLAGQDVFTTAEFIRKPFVELKQEGLDITLNQINLLHHLRPDLAGTGMTLSIKENSFDTADIDFLHRYIITLHTPPVTQLHASNMASISAGGGNSDPTAKGVAWDVTLTSSNFEILLPDQDKYFEDYGINVQNHSYGTGIENYYGIETMAYDESCTRLPDVVHIFSSGNDGDQSPVDGTYAGMPGWANITGQFKQSKNTITVGATDSLANVVPLSSRGPAYDGRIKPEVVAYGQGGTSGAAALVSGLSVLIQDLYKMSHTEILPPSSLVKAILVNTALDIGRPGPDFENGFGSIQGFEAIRSVTENRVLIENLKKGEIKIYPLLIADETNEVKITVSWTDPAAMINVPFSLVNDLDLELKNLATGEIWHPWLLSPFPHPDSLMLAARKGIDTINNVEQISLKSPATGVYEMRIGGDKIKSESQQFSLTWKLDVANTFQWVFPTGSDNLAPGKKNILRWYAVGIDPGIIEFRYIGQNEWHLVEEAINPAIGLLEWTPPSDPGLVQLRWTNAGNTFLSDTFVVSDPVRPVVGFLCKDSLLFYWDHNEYADSFEILRTGERHLENVAYTQDTYYISHNLNVEGFHYAVAPVFGGLNGPRSFGFDYRTQGAGCYLKTFYLREINNGKAFFEADIGTLYNVESVTLSKKVGDFYLPVLSISQVTDINISLDNIALEQGANTFRLEIMLKNGTTIISESITVYFSGEHNVLIFPSPASGKNEIGIVVRSNKSFSLKILDILGRELNNIIDADNPHFLSVSGLGKGQYAAMILYEDGATEVVSFVVLE